MSTLAQAWPACQVSGAQPKPACCSSIILGLFVCFAQRSAVIFFLSSPWPCSCCNSSECITVTSTAQWEQLSYPKLHLLPPGYTDVKYIASADHPQQKNVSNLNVRCQNLIPRHFLKCFSLTENWDRNSSIDRSLAPVDAVITFADHVIHTWTVLKDYSPSKEKKDGASINIISGKKTREENLVCFNETQEASSLHRIWYLLLLRAYGKNGE